MLAGLAENPLQIAASLTLIGVFAAIYHPVGLAMVIEGRKQTGVPLAINGVFGNLGVASAALITGFLIDAWSWRSAFMAPGIASITIGVLYLVFNKIAPEFDGYGDESRLVRRTAIDAAADREEESLRELFERATGDADAWTRWKAVRAIADLGLGPSREAVAALVDDDDFQVRMEVEAVLRAGESMTLVRVQHVGRPPVASRDRVDDLVRLPGLDPRVVRTVGDQQRRADRIRLEQGRAGDQLGALLGLSGVADEAVPGVVERADEGGASDRRRVLRAPLRGRERQRRASDGGDALGESRSGRNHGVAAGGP